MSQVAFSFDTTARLHVVERLAEALRAHYVFPELAGEIADDLLARGGRGEYDNTLTAADFCTALTTHMRELSRDKHFRVYFNPQAPLAAQADPMRDHEEHRLHAVDRAYGIERVERLAGNVGYLKLTGFYAANVAGHAATAAMSLLAQATALIVDLRANGGGEPEMVALFASYLFDEPTHLNDLYYRDGDTVQQFWTLAHVPGPRFGGAKPIYVLTGPHTASGAEEFAYDLQTRKRAIVVGATSAGAAHPGGSFALDAHFAAFIPTGRAINPITGIDWEGTGVVPDVVVPVESALEVAYAAALRAILEQITSPTAGNPGAPHERNGRTQALHDEASNALARLDVSLSSDRR